MPLDIQTYRHRHAVSTVSHFITTNMLTKLLMAFECELIFALYIILYRITRPDVGFL